jgi:hypothetical protein
LKAHLSWNSTINPFFQSINYFGSRPCAWVHGVGSFELIRCTGRMTCCRMGLAESLLGTLDGIAPVQVDIILYLKQMIMCTDVHYSPANDGVRML